MVEWLRECARSGKLPAKATIENLYSNLCKDETWAQLIFNRATGQVHKYNIEMFYLQLFASNILDVAKSGDELFWRIADTPVSHVVSRCNYTFDSHWKGFEWRYSLGTTNILIET